MSSPDPLPTNHDDLRAGESTMLWTLWFAYGAFYFCRTNLSVALPGIEEELGYTKTRMAVVLLGLKLAYAFGQFVNGQLSEQYSPRMMLAIGMFASAALNVAFGFSTGLYFFLFIWACNVLRVGSQLFGRPQVQRCCRIAVAVLLDVAAGQVDGQRVPAAVLDDRGELYVAAADAAFSQQRDAGRYVDLVDGDRVEETRLAVAEVGQGKSAGHQHAQPSHRSAGDVV